MEKLNPFKLLFNRFYHFFFIERFFKSLEFNFPKNIYRWDLIQYIIDKYNYSTYLEIGCDKDQSFAKIRINKKIGVDPISGGTIRDTSNNFFNHNKEKFDIIFIDGLHQYEQVIKDIKNSLNCLTKNGLILLHDCLPRTIWNQVYPRINSDWNGDVWKAIVECRTYENIDTYTCIADRGIGVIVPRKNMNKLILNKNDFKGLKFKDYYQNHEQFMNLISHLDIFKTIE